MSFPTSLSRMPSIPPKELLVTPHISMCMTSLPALTSTFGTIPRFSNYFVWKRHVSILLKWKYKIFELARSIILSMEPEPITLNCAPWELESRASSGSLKDINTWGDTSDEARICVTTYSFLNSKPHTPTLPKPHLFNPSSRPSSRATSASIAHVFEFEILMKIFIERTIIHAR